MTKRRSRHYVGLKRFRYMGCKAFPDAMCDVCAAEPEIFHFVKTADGVERGACCACAEEMVRTGGGGDGGMPTFCEARSKESLGRWISRHIAEEWNR